NPVTDEYILAVSENGCTSSDTVEVTVNPYALVSAGPDNSICIIDSVVALSGFSPADGAWSGSGFTDAAIGLFNPSVSGIGVQSLAYYYTDNVNGCSSGDTMEFTIYGLPIADAGTDVSICSGSIATLLASGGVN